MCEWGYGSSELRSGDAQRSLKRVGGLLRRADIQTGSIALVAGQNVVERISGSGEVLDEDRERNGASDHRSIREPSFIATLGDFTFGFCFAFEIAVYIRHGLRSGQGQAFHDRRLSKLCHFRAASVEQASWFGANPARLIREKSANPRLGRFDRKCGDAVARSARIRVIAEEIAGS